MVTGIKKSVCKSGVEVVDRRTQRSIRDDVSETPEL